MAGAQDKNEVKQDFFEVYCLKRGDFGASILIGGGLICLFYI
jgi:hypothetical protein